MEPVEVEFLAEKELVTILLNFSLDRIHLIGVGGQGLGGWIWAPARGLKGLRTGLGEKLEEIWDQECKEDTFTLMPSPYYMELTKLLLNYASDNIPKADEICMLVKDTWDTRIAKLWLSADSFIRQQEAHAKLDNLILMEINTTRAFLTQALDHMYKLQTNLQPDESAHSQDF
ncbi:DNA replication complex GINS protein PSF2-like [Strigops habroptila]|uniref:GINS complex subunit 2 n=1 Tax=Strigops habroptila TaxID=2489341 RepID=A0A672TGZ1_STRHB|nr:DNA replication complex GINS protein PSF2-like [Strigops habroptila]